MGFLVGGLFFNNDKNYSKADENTIALRLKNSHTRKFIFHSDFGFHENKDGFIFRPRNKAQTKRNLVFISKFTD